MKRSVFDNTAIRVTYIRGRERLDSDGSLECTPSHRHQSFITQSWTIKTRGIPCYGDGRYVRVVRARL